MEPPSPLLEGSTPTITRRRASSAAVLPILNLHKLALDGAPSLPQPTPPITVWTHLTWVQTACWQTVVRLTDFQQYSWRDHLIWYGLLCVILSLYSQATSTLTFCLHTLYWLTVSVVLCCVVGYALFFYFRLPRLQDLRGGWSGLTIAHRGYRGVLNIPENSMKAFRYAYEHGSDGIEVDVSLSADGQVIVMHDCSVDRTCEAKGHVNALTLEELKKIKYKNISNNEWTSQDELNEIEEEKKLFAKYNGNIPKELREKVYYARNNAIPTLEEVIQYCKTRKLRLMVELKEANRPALIREKVAALFDKYDMFEWAYVATFHPLHLYQFRCLRPDISTCLLYCRDCVEWYNEEQSHEMELPSWLNARWSRYVLDLVLLYLSPSLLIDLIGAPILGPHDILVNSELLSDMKAKGILIDAWVVNNENEKDWLLDYGNCIVTTDRLFRTVSDDHLQPEK